MIKRILNKGILILGLFVVLLHGCASSGSTTNSDQSHIYSRSFNEMVEVVEQAVRGNGYNIEHVFREEEANKITLIINKYISAGGRPLQENQGTVVIKELKKDKVEITIENPEYHFTVPRYQRERYDRIIYRGIDSILQKG